MKNNDSVSVKFIDINTKTGFNYNNSNSNDDEDYVNYGYDNMFPKELLKYYDGVSIHKGIIETKINLIKEKGLIIGDDVDLEIDELWNKIVTDYVIYFGVFLLIQWDHKNQKIKNIIHLDVNKCRSDFENLYGEVENYFYYDGDEVEVTKHTDIYDFTEYKSFNPNNKDESQIFYIKNYNPISKYYGIPDYASALKDLDTFKAISDFHNAAIHNGMNPGYAVFFKGPKPSEERQDEIIDGFKKNNKGVDKANSPIIYFMDDKTSTEIELIEPNRMDKMYQELYKTTQENIITSHTIPRILANVATPGSLGGGKEYNDALIQFKNKFVYPVQSFLLKKLNHLMSFNYEEDIKIDLTPVDLSQYTITELLELYSATELKELLGLPKIN